MNVAMGFPETVEEFMESYKMTDTEHIYSNGIEYVPIFRMKQWFEHIKGSEDKYIEMWTMLKGFMYLSIASDKKSLQELGKEMDKTDFSYLSGYADCDILILTCIKELERRGCEDPIKEDDLYEAFNKMKEALLE
jgi:hypothetical protein